MPTSPYQYAMMSSNHLELNMTFARLAIRQFRVYLTLLPLLLVVNCGGPTFTAADNIAGTAGEAGSSAVAEAAASDRESAGRDSSAGSAGYPHDGPGGNASTDGGSSSGAASGPRPPSECLADYSTKQCADACTGSAYPECRTVLNCLIAKNVKPPESPLDPCYPSDYIPLTIATKVYMACCQ